MYFVFFITALFIIISVYYFFRAEKLQRQIIQQQRDSSATRKENKVLVESLSLVALREQEFAKVRLLRIKNYANTVDNKKVQQHVELITPLINSYSLIFRECLKGRGRLKAMCQKCFEKQDPKAYKNFVAMIVTSDKNLKRYWASDSLNGFLFLVDALLSIEAENTQLSPVADTKQHSSQDKSLIS